MKFRLLTTMLIAFLLSSCNDSEPKEFMEGENLFLNLRVTSLTTTVNTTGPQELIKSLRIIILSDGFIEYNDKFDYSSSGSIHAADLAHQLQRATVAGNKKFYFIANEESVPSLEFDTSLELPQGISEGMSLSEFLNHYTKEKLPAGGTLGYTGAGTGEEFETFLNCAVFTPDFSFPDGIIYLPYSAYYQGLKATEDPDVTQTITAYLVPTATKFTIKVKNYRKEDVEVLKIALAEVHTKSFLMANLDDSELYKNFAGINNLYWIDWLRLVAEGSQAFTGNYEDVYEDLGTFNNRAGWIENYSVPSNNNLKYRDTLEPSMNGQWFLNHLVDKDNPESFTIVKYYPESIHTVVRKVYNSETKQYEDKDVQAYFAQFKVIDRLGTDLPVEPYDSEDIEIDKLKSLFRATHVAIDVDIHESLVEIYCQIAPWSIRKFQGYVQEEED